MYKRIQSYIEYEYVVFCYSGRDSIKKDFRQMFNAQIFVHKSRHTSCNKLLEGDLAFIA